MRALVAVIALGWIFVPMTSVAQQGGVAARVNGVPIAGKDVQQLAKRIADGAGTTADRVWNDALEQMITLELLAQTATAEGLKVSPAEVEQEVKDVQSGLGTNPELAKSMQSTPPADFRKELQRSLLIDKLIQKHVVVKITPQEVQNYYEQNKEQFERPQMLRASHILITIQTNDPDAAQKRMLAIQERLKKGEDFAKVAKEVSQDALTAPKGGDLGFFPPRSTPVAEAAFKLKPGQMSDIVKSPYGLHIIKVTDTKPPGLAPLAEVSDQIRGMLDDEQREDREDAYIEDLRSKAKIEILQKQTPEHS